MFGMGYFLGLGIKKATGGTTPLSVLGTRLKVEFTGNETSYIGGTCTDDISANKIGQDTAGMRPTLSTTPAGNNVFNYDAVDDLLTPNFTGGTGQLDTLAALPAFGTGQRLFFCIFKVAFQATVNINILGSGGDGTIYIGGYDTGLLTVVNSASTVHIYSNLSVADNTWQRAIFLYDETAPLLTMYVNGIAQVLTTASIPFGAPSSWGEYGLPFANSFGGLIGRFGFAYTATTFGAQMITDLDSALTSIIG